MTGKPTYEELEKRILTLEREKAELLRARAALQESESSFSQLFESAPVPMAYASESDGYTGTTWNKAWYRTFGYSREEADSRSGKEIGIWVDPGDRFRLLEMANRQNYVANFEARLRRKDSAVRNCSLFCRFIERPGGRLLMVIYFDVTEQKLAQKMMMQGEKMLSLGGLAAGMAHEINNPLAGMIQTASLMSNRLGGGADIPANDAAARDLGTTVAAIRRYMEARGVFSMIDNILTSGKRVAGIVENMLSFARKSDASVSSHNPAELLDKTLELAATDYDLKRHYDFRSIRIVKAYDPDLPPLPCHGARIQQVFLNILRNGAQAMQEKLAQTEGYHPEFVLRVTRESQMVRIEIEDNGPGMEEDICKRIFEPFFTTKPVGVGTGLGLSISYFIITENHGGQMSVTSRPGMGTTFVIRLPQCRS